MNQDDIPQGDSDEDILKRARARFELCEEAEQEIRKDALDDLKFCAGDQWPEDVKTARQLDNRPCLTINLLPERLRIVINEQRQNRPSIKVNPVDDHGDKDTAEVFQGLIRHIEYSSNAEIAYDTASDGQVKGGFGYFRLITEYLDAQSFDLEPKFKRIRDPFSVYLDPNYTEPDGRDADYGFIIDSMSKEAYQRDFPKSKAGQLLNWGSLMATSGGWMNKDEIRVAEYYEKQRTPTKLFKLSNGQIVQAKSLDEQTLLGLGVGEDGQPLTIVDERDTEIIEVKWYKINGIDILDRTDVHGTYIPIFPVLGDEYFIDGRRILESLVRHAKDPQRMTNYWKTAATEMIALAPKAPFIGYEGQFEGFEDQWKQANNKSFPFLQHKIVTLPSGQAAPPPERNTYEPPVQAINQQSMQSAQDIKATTGVQDAQIGLASQEISGVAIQRRVNQSNVTNFHFGDNFKRTLRHAGCVLLEWIPKIYTGPRAVRVLGEDGQQKIVKINQIFEQGGQKKGFYLDQGKYDVTVDTGPSYQTRRQEAVADMLDLTKSVPAAMQNALDLLVRKMDWPGADKIADRLEKLLPPGLAESNDENQAPVPPAAQQQIIHGQKIMDQQSHLIAQQDEVIRTKKLEIESKERLEALKLKNDVVIEYMKHDLAGAKILLEADIEQINQRLALLRENAAILPADGSAGTPSASAGQVTPTGGPSPG